MGRRELAFSIGFRAAVAMFLMRFALGAAVAEAPERDDPALQAFIEAHICIVEERLHMIRATVPGNPDSKDRFLAIGPVADGDRFTQCIFFDGDRMVYCEAASGWFSGTTEENRRLRLDRKSVAALARLGFDTAVEEGNFRQEFPIADARDVRRVAELLLAGLHSGYGVTASDALTIVSPLAPQGYRSSRCHPTS